MSAYMMTDTHLSRLAEVIAGLAPYTNEGPFEGGPAEAYEVLLHENAESIAYRYDHDFAEQLANRDDGVPFRHRMERAGRRYRPDAANVQRWRRYRHNYQGQADPHAVAAAVQMANGYNYQACEHPQWTRSLAHQYTQAVTAWCASNLAEQILRDEQGSYWSLYDPVA